jgi:hypothetical protein
MNKFRVSIQPPAAGWLEIRIAGEGGEARLCASYTPRDSFYDLVSSVLALYEHGSDQVVLINEEPEVVEVRLLRREDRLVVMIATDRGARTTRIESSFHSGCREFARRFHLAMEKVGYEGFVEHWRHRPPRDAISKLWSYFE